MNLQKKYRILNQKILYFKLLPTFISDCRCLALINGLYHAAGIMTQDMALVAIGMRSVVFDQIRSPVVFDHLSRPQKYFQFIIKD